VGQGRIELEDYDMHVSEEFDDYDDSSEDTDESDDGVDFVDFDDFIQTSSIREKKDEGEEGFEKGGEGDEGERKRRRDMSVAREGAPLPKKRLSTYTPKLKTFQLFPTSFAKICREKMVLRRLARRPFVKAEELRGREVTVQKRWGKRIDMGFGWKSCMEMKKNNESLIETEEEPQEQNVKCNGCDKVFRNKKSVNAHMSFCTKVLERKGKRAQNKEKRKKLREEVEELERKEAEEDLEDLVRKQEEEMKKLLEQKKKGQLVLVKEAENKMETIQSNFENRQENLIKEQEERIRQIKIQFDNKIAVNERQTKKNIFKEEKVKNEKQEALENEFLVKIAALSTKQKAERQQMAKLQKEQLDVSSFTGPRPPAPQCPICFDPLGPPGQVFQCGNNHLLCGACRPQIQECPSKCGQPMAGRAYGTEAILGQLFPEKE